MVDIKTIKGQAYLVGNSLIQDQILIHTENGETISVTNNTAVLIENIWDDLKSSTGIFKTNNKDYWYWEYSITDTKTDEDVTVLFECPVPSPDLFYDEATKNYVFDTVVGDSDWVLYWKALMKKTYESSYNSTNGLQSKEVVFPGTKYIDSKGDVVTVNETTISRDNLSDFSNLLG